MIEHWHEVYRVMQFGLQVIGIGTIVRAIPKGIQWLLKLRKQRLENRVLQTFYDMDDGPWQSAHGVVGELYLKAALNDARGYFAPMPTGWKDLKHSLRVFPYPATCV